MGWQDRDYGNPQQHQRMVRPGMPSTLTGWVMGLVVVGFFVSVASQKAVAWSLMAKGSVIPGAQVWRLVSYPWVGVHDGDTLGLLLGLLLNLAMLWTFGRLAEMLLPRGRWLAVAGVGAVAGALVLECAWKILPQWFVVPAVAGPMVVVFALMGACLARVPRQGFGLFFLPVEIELRWIVAFVAGLSLLLVLTGSSSASGELAHLAAMGAGFGMAKLPSGRPVVRGSSISPARSPFSAIQEKIHNWRHHRGAQSLAEHQVEVDRILAKIKREGMGKLTGAEKRTLQRDTARLRK